jgi:hypothetical protein
MVTFTPVEPAPPCVAQQQRSEKQNDLNREEFSFQRIQRTLDETHVGQ